MYISSRKADIPTQKQRWLKYITYIIIVTSIIVSTIYYFFYLLAILIVCVGLFEILRNRKASLYIKVISLLSYTAISLLFILYSYTIPVAFLLYIYFQIAIFDGFSQIAGQLLGKHKLVSHISPNKTIEGLAGGILFTTLVAFLTRDWVQVSAQKAILYGLLTSLFALSGDLLASYFKRLNHIKDYSNILPGHGGFLDRFDSLMMTGAAYYLLLYQTDRIV
ncbi:phosphatidate cytidylyltransferase [Xanthocytophaga agilis]|uniref:Phosphatidate cytidylyltransferase n=1 Tax=Xanthocytophaga agilis TaxID=3048010 RepID=A0AAE3RA95_9BACT|nr:phosphatidate cytidylyltransferase [Xanthocytophaga agilis]MDJ1504385.1 phosphatidate cytidylyltransferase [Xanthocytophaga agilis]